MMNLYLTALLTSICLTTANFIWEIVTDHNWAEAFKLSFFQLVAIAVLTGTLVILKSRRITS